MYESFFWVIITGGGGGTPLYLQLLHPPAVHSLTSGYGLSCGC